MINHTNKEAATLLAEQQTPIVAGKKPYISPKLEKLGDIRGMTMGGSIGSGESGAPTIRRNQKFGG